MKKTILIMMFSFGMLNALADGCQSLANTNWSGTVTFSDGTTTDLKVSIQAVTPDQANSDYDITGIANGVAFSGSGFGMDNQCAVNMFNSSVVQSLTIDNSVMNILSQNVSASQIAALHGHVNGKFIQSGSMNKQ